MNLEFIDEESDEVDLEIDEEELSVIQITLDKCKEKGYTLPACWVLADILRYLSANSMDGDLAVWQIGI